MVSPYIGQRCQFLDHCKEYAIDKQEKQFYWFDLPSFLQFCLICGISINQRHLGINDRIKYILLLWYLTINLFICHIRVFMSTRWKIHPMGHLQFCQHYYHSISPILAHLNMDPVSMLITRHQWTRLSVPGNREVSFWELGKQVTLLIVNWGEEKGRGKGEGQLIDLLALPQVLKYFSCKFANVSPWQFQFGEVVRWVRLVRQIQGGQKVKWGFQNEKGWGWP